MKFLCVRCDEAMTLERAEDPEDGSLSVVFACAECGNRVAMLTNPWETQLVRALDVKIGGRSSPAEPMEFVRSMLGSKREAGLDAANPGSHSGAPPSAGCPFSAMMNLAAGKPGVDRESENRRVGESERSEPAPASPAGQVRPGCTWTPEAERRLERVPEFIRPMVRQGIEQFAVQRGYKHITDEVMAEARGALGM